MKLFEITNAINVGLWLTPTGEYIKVQTNHVADIISNPETFSVTSEFINQLYAKHGERLGVEGNAREELIKLVLQRGWVRIRNYKNYWSVTVDRLSRKVNENIRNWVDSFIKDGIMGKYADIKVYEVIPDKMQTFDAIHIVTKYALEESVKMITETTFDKVPVTELLTEVKLSRAYHIFTDPKFAVGIISAFRGDAERTLAMNVRDNRALAADLRNAGFGYSWIDGAWIENQGTEEERHSAEVSILVTSDANNQDKLFGMLVDAAKRYNQDAFVFQKTGIREKTEEEQEILRNKNKDVTAYGPKETALPVHLYDKNGNTMMEFKTIRMDQIADNYSRLRSGGHAGRSFVFESVRSPVGFFGRLAGLSDT